VRSSLWLAGGPRVDKHLHLADARPVQWMQTHPKFKLGLLQNRHITYPWEVVSLRSIRWTSLLGRAETGQHNMSVGRPKFKCLNNMLQYEVI
jgi:hypothetical protein